MKMLVVEDHALVRDGLCGALQALGPGVEVTAVEHVEAALDALQGADYDLVTLDLMLPGMRGQTALPVLRRRFPTVPVLVVSALDDPENIAKALAAGAAGFVPKAAPVSDLLDAVRAVLAGDEWLPPAQRHLFDRQRHAPPVESPLAKRFALSPAQARVLEVLAEGGSNRQIAEILGLSEGTVKIHVSAIFKALGVSNRAEAVLLATRASRR